MPLEALRQALAARALRADRRDDAAAAAAGRIVEWGGDSVRALVFFGSRKTRALPDPWSAYDYFVLTRGYAPFYGSLHRAGALRRRPGLVAALNAWLPPNQISLRGSDPNGAPWHAKCAVIELDRLVTETSAQRHDHFCLGRLCQPVELMYAADDAARESVLSALASAHALTFDWVRPWLPGRFDTAEYCRTMLRVSLAREVRPEPVGRAEALFDAQREELLPVYGVLLDGLARGGALRALGDGSYGLARPVTGPERARLRGYFAWSLIRATARWAKYVVTFDDWLEYIVRKAERHSGQTIVLSPRERRYPLLFLWPRFLRFYRRDRNRKAARP
jgi:hypothetical protein